MSGPRYVSGDHWKICEVCGFQTRSSRTFKRWDGLLVCEADFETRHPQDFVRGSLDNQSVQDPRPEATENIIGPLTTTISAAAVSGTQTISVASSTRFLAADHIGVMLNGGNMERHVILSIPSATSIEMTTSLGGAVSIGNIVIDYSAVSEADIG